MQYLPLDKAEVLRYLGYRHKQELTAEISQLIDDLMIEVQEKSNAVYLFRNFPIELNPEKTEVKVVGTELILTGKNIYHHLKNAQSVVLLVGSLGIAIERVIRLYEVSELTKARILDSCCVEYIEKVLDLAEVEIAATFPDYTLNRRFSPGYGDLPLVPTQRDFLNTMNASKELGITLTTTNLMIPRKSVTAIIGLFENPEQAKPKRKVADDLTLEMAKNGRFNIKAT
ncbi:vitamin B12 dependent-methionine synthase activation domain-containing protein [Lactococcus nasutitermitis]|uniref:Vitamin B12 dependent-methionine synthase activation domain-containing protein n=1 Tax=Lactococcus nasutitermitis TaxID=1652957 RepID=A0ABV9JAQ7_9LACT|nr:vitamin B12 dependent-methionine synthase activation domain-containing protein [Lactococcus nasutitermitis]